MSRNEQIKYLRYVKLKKKLVYFLKWRVKSNRTCAITTGKMSTVNANMIWKSVTVFIRQFQCIVGLKRSNWKNNCLSRFDCYHLFHDGGPYHINTSPLICRANQWTGFYMIGTSVMKGLIMVNQAHANNSMFIFANIDTGSNTWNLFKVNDKNNSGRCGFL